MEYFFSSRCCNKPNCIPVEYFKNKNVTKVTKFYCNYCGSFSIVAKLEIEYLEAVEKLNNEPRIVDSESSVF
jgi:hypothetical protein